MPARPPPSPLQLSLFAPEPALPRAPDARARLAAERPALEALAAHMPPLLAMGTSSWSFPGWAGIVYSAHRDEADLAREGLTEYAQHPLMRTVGIDRGYYAPIPRADLERYATQLPAGFRCCTKAPERITSPVTAARERGAPAEPNPDFLSAPRFMELMGDDFAAAFGDHAGPFIFEFPPARAPHRLAPRAFLDRLDGFLAALPTTFQYAIELRDRAYLTPAYREVLAAHGAAHTYNYWTAMPHPHEQLATVPIDTAPFAVVRLLLRPGTRYAARKNDMAPFDQLLDIDQVMRRGVVTIVRLATASGRKIYLLVNNKAEGSSPLTIRAIAELLSQPDP